MATFLILLTSFILAAAGVVQSSQAPPEKRNLLGMTTIGIVMLLVAIIGFGASAAKEVADARVEAQLRRQAEADSQMLKLVNAKLDYLAEVTNEPEMVREIEQLRDQMNLSASRARESDLSLSDFSQSRFDGGNFTLTYFPRALFKDAGFNNARFDGSSFQDAAFPGANFGGADFRGVDLSGIIIDENTRLPGDSRNRTAAPEAAAQRR